MPTTDLPEPTFMPDSGLACLVMLARYHDVVASPEHLSHAFLSSEKHFTTTLLLQAFQSIELKARSLHCNMARLARTPLPAIALDANGSYFIIARVEGEQVLIQDPLVAAPRTPIATARKGNPGGAVTVADKNREMS